MTANILEKGIFKNQVLACTDDMLIAKLLTWGFFLSSAKAPRWQRTLDVTSVEVFNKSRYTVL